MERPLCSNGDVEGSESMKNRRLGMRDLAQYHNDKSINVQEISCRVYDGCNDRASDTYQSAGQADAESDEEEKIAC